MRAVHCIDLNSECTIIIIDKSLLVTYGWLESQKKAYHVSAFLSIDWGVLVLHAFGFAFSIFNST